MTRRKRKLLPLKLMLLVVAKKIVALMTFIFNQEVQKIFSRASSKDLIKNDKDKNKNSSKAANTNCFECNKPDHMKECP